MENILNYFCGFVSPFPGANIFRVFLIKIFSDSDQMPKSGRKETRPEKVIMKSD